VIGDIQFVKDVNLLSAGNMRDILHWNNKTSPETEYSSILDIIIHQARKRPMKLAISSWDGEMSYKKLDELSSKASQYLTSLGLGPRDIVPICFEKSMWAVVAILAVMKSGAAFVPLDPALPSKRLKVSCSL